MRTSTKLLLLLLIAGLTPQAFAQGAGNCVTGTAISFISVNDVQASLFNSGGLFFGGSTTSGDGYLVPKASGNSPIFASGIWVAGTVNGDPRVAAARYGGYDFWPGPLDENTGLPVNPNDCSEFDRLYNVTRQDIADYEAGLPAARDLAEWPVDLGAPVVDGDGDPTNYNLAGGDRPEIIGDQGIWWVMNDAGNDHNPGAPLGIEVQVLAWAFARADALGQTTFYRYRVINKNSVDITDAYISIFSDPDLGDAGDDYIGVDTTLSLGFVYNDSNEDSAYGSPPPAAGYDFFQGPIVGDDTLGATAFSTFINGGPAGTVDPGTPEAYRNYMQGLWGDGTPYYEFGTGYLQSASGAPITKFIYAGDPVTESYYSEVNNDGQGTDSPQGDRRLVISTGPFTLERGVPQDIVMGIVFAQGTDNLNSVAALRSADVLAQTAYDVGFRLAPPPPPPPLCNVNSPNVQLRPGSGGCLEAVEQDGQVTLVWGYPSTSSNYLAQFEVEDALLEGQDVTDSTYNMEGFNIYRFPTSSFQVDQRQLVATFDKANGVTTVIDQVGDPDTGGLIPAVVARGTDSGIEYAFDIPGLTNNTDYFYGITAYSHNDESTPKVIESAATQITVRPARLSSGNLAQSGFGDELDVTTVTQRGQGIIAARVVDPTSVTGATYTVDFFTSDDGAGNTATNYNITNSSSGEVVFDGAAYFARTGNALPQEENVAVIDGVSFSVTGPPSAIDTRYTDSPSWIEVANPNRADVCGADASSTAGCDLFDNNGNPIYHSLNADARYYFSEQGTGSEALIGQYAPNDFEIRFTDTGSIGYWRFQGYQTIRLPFEVWDIGPTGTGANDPADDVQLIPVLFSDNGGTCEFAYGEIAEEATFGFPATDRIYAYYPSTSYADFDAALGPLVDAAPDGCYTSPESLNSNTTGTRPIQRQVFADFAGDGVLPASGTVARVLTTKPNLPGDQFSISTADRQVLEQGVETAEEALDRIAMVPNPYLGESDYETGNLSRVVRITNLPPEATTIQIYTVAGTLVRTLNKEGSSRSLDWDMQTQSGLPVASGMYLVRVEVAGVGERIMKFGLVNRRSRITLF
ncbi:MAG: T9SS type A sorting domain-containing protein [Bacteroidota bacterium]